MTSTVKEDQKGSKMTISEHQDTEKSLFGGFVARFKLDLRETGRREVGVVTKKIRDPRIFKVQIKYS
jgi:hypothetical protein